ncbi:hypothetical protein QIS74_09518 [Colletotrichum tabaci]|uniref:Uncharacterized protein n=1 Tax=Colletotrichum tabaci TaxID=1209068 RepID=A0AAV9T716_9PEZI
MAFMIIHLVFFFSLHGKPVESSFVGQSLQSAIANFLAIAVEICLLSGLGVAYDQLLWRLFRKKALPAVTIDKLIRLATSPWNLPRPGIFLAAPEPWLVASLCLLVPLAIVFPPGALTVEYREAVQPVTLHDVPTMNISDWGNGTAHDLYHHALFEIPGELVTSTSIRAILQLESVADRVLASGEPVPLRLPCKGTCNYTSIIEGPKFNCRQASLTELPGYDQRSANGTLEPFTKCRGGDVFLAWDEVETKLKIEDSFKVAWFPIKGGSCVPNATMKAMACSTALATYRLTIATFQNGSRDIRASILNETAISTGKPMGTSLHEYFPGQKFVNESKAAQDDLTIQFRILQALAIRQAAVQSLTGTILYKYDLFPGVPALVVNGTRAAGSPYIGIRNKFGLDVNITAESLQSYLQDVLISSISLNWLQPETLWTYSEPIEAFEGAAVYLFSEPWQFYAPYGSCLAVTTIVYLLGYQALRRNGSSAGNSFLQIVSTTSPGGILRELGEECSSGGSENFSKEFKEVKLRFGIKRMDEGPEATKSDGAVALLGTEVEIEP